MVDEAGKAWQSVVKQLAEDLPGEWAVGRPGVKAILVRAPIDWRLCWAGLDRPRRTDEPYLIAGVVDLIRPFSLGYQHGLRSDAVNRPGRVELTGEHALEQVHSFVVEHAVPTFDRWSAAALAEEAEQKFALPQGERGRPILYPSAAGWRVVNDTVSPLEPARQAAAEFEEMLVPDDARWYADLANAWESGGRDGALEFLQQHRQGVLSSLKLG